MERESEADKDIHTTTRSYMTVVDGRDLGKDVNMRRVERQTERRKVKKGKNRKKKGNKEKEGTNRKKGVKYALQMSPCFISPFLLLLLLLPLLLLLADVVAHLSAIVVILACKA